MQTITDAEIKLKGLNALIEALGEVNAERFIALVNREPFDYTSWQKTIYSNISVTELSRRAMDVRNETGKK